MLNSHFCLAVGGKGPRLVGVVGGRLAEDFRQLLNTELTLGGVGLSSKVRVTVVPAPFEGRAARQRVGISCHHLALLSWCRQANQSTTILERWNVFLVQRQGSKGERARWWQVHHRKPLVEFIRRRF